MQFTHVFLEEKYRLHILGIFWAYMVTLGARITLFQKILGVYFQKIIKNQSEGVILIRVAQSKAETAGFQWYIGYYTFFLIFMVILTLKVKNSVILGISHVPPCYSHDPTNCVFII